MHSRTLNKENFSFFTGWPKENIDQCITFEFSNKNGHLEFKDLSSSGLLIKHDKGYDLNLGGHRKPFIRTNPDGSFEIRTPYAAHPFFTWHGNNDSTIISDNYSLFAQYGDTSKLNKQYCALRLMGEVPGLHLPFTGTKFLFPCFVYSFGKTGLSPEKSVFQIDESGSSMAQAFEQVDALYAEYCSQKSNVIASLTGGYDSRFYATMLRRHLKKEQLYFFYVGDYEAYLSASVAKALDANFRSFDAPDTIHWLRQNPVSFYGDDNFYRASNGLWREEGLYLFNATAAAGRTIFGTLNDDTGFMGMCIESANKGSNYDYKNFFEKMMDRMYVERHPDLAKFRDASTYKTLDAPILEDLYQKEFSILENSASRPDILIDIYTYHLVTFPKSTLRNGVYSKSGRTYYPLMDERFFNAYLGVPAAEKENIGLYRYGFNQLNKKLLSLPHRSMDTLKAGMNITSSGSVLQKINHTLRIKLGLAKKFKAPKRNWKNEETEALLGSLVRTYYSGILPEMDQAAWKWMYSYEIYLFGGYLDYLSRQSASSLAEHKQIIANA